MSITQNAERIGNFTSSEISALMGNAKKAGELSAPAKTYIEECNMERELGRSISSESNARPLSWGKMLEKRAFDILGMEYILSSTETDIHPTIEYWAGSKDAIKHDEGKTIVDIKCPITLKSFYQLIKGGTIEYIRENHKDGDKYFWQLVSNAIINDCRFAELIVYVPYKSELEDIREMVRNYDGDQNKVAWINWSADEDLPYLIDGGNFKNLNIIRFEVSETDKKILIEKVLEAGKFLI